jgi:spheroidene monooxygenase
VKAAGLAPGGPSVLVLLLVRWRTPSLPWGLMRLVLGSRTVGHWPGLRFARVLGSGRGGGFGLAPSLHHQGLVAFFDGRREAEDFVEHSDCVAEYRWHAAELALVIAETTASRGSWSGATLAPTAAQPAGQRCAVLTRAAIRVRQAHRFWRHSPATGEGIRQAAGCQLAVGLGEAPLLRQATFSLWEHSDAMDQYARRGAHQQAIEGAWREGWFNESMFVRLRPLVLEGSWHGRALDPIG